MKDKGNIFFIIFTLLIFATILTALYYKKDEIEVGRLILNPSQKKQNHFRCLVVANVALKHLRLKFSIPCNDLTEITHLNKNMSRLKHDMLLSIDNDKMSRSIEDRDFDNIRKTIISVVNRHTRKPVKTIYFENFFFN